MVSGGTVEARLTAGRLLLRGLRRHRGRILLGVVLLSAHQATEAMVPVAIGVIIDRAVATGDVGALLLSVAGLAVLFTALALAWRFGARQAVVAIQRETHQLRMEVTARLLDPRGQRGGLRAGELLSVATSDAERAAMAVRAGSAGVAAMVALAVASAALLTIDVPLGAGVLLGVPVLVLLPQALAPMLTRRSLSQQAAVAGTTALAADLVGGLRALRGIGAQGNAARRYRRASQDALSVTLRAARTDGASEGLTVAASGLFLAGVAGVAGWFGLNGRLTIGELITVVGLAQFVAEPMRALGMCGRLAAMARASAARLAAVLNAPPLVEPGTLQLPPRQAGPRVALEAVSYRTLQDVHVAVAAGELLGIVTHDPADADSLLALLSGRVPRGDYQGRVLVDGISVEDLDVDASRVAVLVEQHDVDLFEGTVRSNLLAGAPAAEGPRLEGALRAAAADEVVDAHPDGLDQVVTDRGATLSGGQRQRIGLARALLADPPVLVLHDPTTAVDAVTEEQIAGGLAALRGAGPDGPGTVMLTSSPALLSQAHRVVVIDGGKVSVEGRHAELAESDRRYREAVLR